MCQIFLAFTFENQALIVWRPYKLDSLGNISNFLSDFYYRCDIPFFITKLVLNFFSTLLFYLLQFSTKSDLNSLRKTFNVENMMNQLCYIAHEGKLTSVSLSLNCINM